MYIYHFYDFLLKAIQMGYLASNIYKWGRGRAKSKQRLKIFLIFETFEDLDLEAETMENLVQIVKRTAENNLWRFQTERAKIEARRRLWNFQLENVLSLIKNLCCLWKDFHKLILPSVKESNFEVLLTTTSLESSNPDDITPWDPEKSRGIWLTKSLDKRFDGILWYFSGDWKCRIQAKKRSKRPSKLS